MCPGGIANEGRSRRFIPTSVGRLWCDDRHACRGDGPVHPHERGAVNLPSRIRTTWPGSGSSPRAWGGSRDALRSATGGRIRFIPTSVGRFQARCGLDLARLEVLGRFIPTSVGRFPGPSQRSKGGGRTVHPHERGAVASPPRRPGSNRMVRFIPTSVGRFGEKPSGSGLIGPSTVHPHERGAVAGQMAEASRQIGSSPRAWGGWTAFLLGEVRLSDGSSPRAWGGCKDGGRAGRWPETVHPHERGAVERARIALSYVAMFGSSPRAWGGYYDSA